MSFCYSAALTKLKNENATVRRTGWNEKGMWIRRVTAWNANIGVDLGDEFSFAPFIVMKAVDNSLVPWNPSQADMEAVDWEEAIEVCVTSHSPDRDYFNTWASPVQDPVSNKDKVGISLFLVPKDDAEAIKAANFIVKTFHPSEKYEIVEISFGVRDYKSVIAPYLAKPTGIDLYIINIDQSFIIEWHKDCLFPPLNRLYCFDALCGANTDLTNLMNKINHNKGYPMMKMFVNVDGSYDLPTLVERFIMS